MMIDFACQIDMHYMGDPFKILALTEQELSLIWRVFQEHTCLHDQASCAIAMDHLIK